MAQEFFLRMARGDTGLVYAVVRSALVPVAGLFGWAVSFRNSLYDRNILARRRASVPVVSVGNLTVGGTGKTPTVAFVTRALLALGRKPGILSRGYGSRADEDGLSDENLQLSESLPGVPLLEDRDRVRGSMRLVAQDGVDCIVLDDGFQHRRLARDLDLCLVDATTPVGSGWLLPAGTSREHLEGLCRATVVLLTRCDLVSRDDLDKLKERISSWGFEGEVLSSVMRPVSILGPGGRDLSWLRDKSVYLFSGVGNPSSFQRAVEDLGATVCGYEVFTDHHAYRREDVSRVSIRAGEAGAACVLTTVKDWVKVRHLVSDGPPPLNALDVELSITGGETVLDRLLAGLFDEEEERL